MLIPTGLSKKERSKYVKNHKHQINPDKINVGPKAGLRPVGGDKAILEGLIAKFHIADEDAVTASKAFEDANEILVKTISLFDEAEKEGKEGKDLEIIQSTIDSTNEKVKETESIADETAEIAEGILIEIAIIEEKLR